MMIKAPSSVLHHRQMAFFHPSMCHAARPVSGTVITSPLQADSLRRAPVVAASAGKPAQKGFGTQKTPQLLEACPCESGRPYKRCCEPAHTGAKAASTPEGALRARFSAFKKGEQQFIADTTHPDYLAFHYEGKTPEEAKEQYLKDINAGCTMFDYAQFKVDKSEPGSNDDEGFVSFNYKSCIKAKEGEDPNMRDWKTTNEKSRFLRVNGVWVFAEYQRFEYSMNTLMQSTPARAAITELPPAKPAN